MGLRTTVTNLDESTHFGRLSALLKLQTFWATLQ